MLLKNLNARLPLKQPRNTRIGVVGSSANDSLVLLGNYHGAPAYDKVVTPLEAIIGLCGREHVRYTPGAWVAGEGTWDFTSALQVANASDVAVVFLGGSAKGTVAGVTHYDTTEKEGMDRTEIGLPGVQLDLLKALATQTSTPIVVVLINGGTHADFGNTEFCVEGHILSLCAGTIRFSAYWRGALHSQIIA